MKVSPPLGFHEDDFLCNVCLEKIEKRQIEDLQIPSHHQFELHKNEILRRKSQYKQLWDKDGVIQFKNERIAVLLRMWLKQIEFIIAFDDLVKEGYRLVAVDEAKEPDPHGGWNIGGESYFYFQKM